jgi:serine protease DegS
MRELIRYVLIPALVGGIIGLLVMFVVYFNEEPASPAKPGYANAVRIASPAVVNIYSHKVVKPPICQQPRYREWCNRFTGIGRTQMQSSLGSGVIVREDGYILTNIHVIDGADEILVAFADGKATTATLVGNDPETDLAVIKVEVSGLTPILPVDPRTTEVGDVVLAIGNPFGMSQTVSAGIISAKGRTGISDSPYDDYIQTDAAINPGNSGGALIDTNGYLIGINSLIYSRSGGSDGIGFAIPAQLAISILDEIIATGRVTRGWLGVGLTISPPQGNGVGLQVTEIITGGPAYKAGLLLGDLILSVNEQPAVSSAVVSRQIAHAEPGSTIEMDILRNGRQVALTAIAGIRPLEVTN